LTDAPGSMGFYQNQLLNNTAFELLAITWLAFTTNNSDRKYTPFNLVDGFFPLGGILWLDEY